MAGKRVFYALRRVSCLPNSIVERQKSPYPSTQDPAYEKALRAEVAEVLEDRSHPATSLLNRKVIEDMLARPVGTTSSLPERAGLERARSISAWVKDYGVAAGPVARPSEVNSVTAHSLSREWFANYIRPAHGSGMQGQLVCGPCGSTTCERRVLMLGQRNGAHQDC